MRLLAMHHIQQGKTYTAVSEIVASHRLTVQSWLRRFREEGFEGLFESKRSGAKKKFTEEDEAWLSEKIQSLSESKTGGYITGKELHQLLAEQQGTTCCQRTVYNYLHRLGFSCITSRSIHPKADEDAQETYKKTLPLS